jgi:hypothetical protein
MREAYRIRMAAHSLALALILALNLSQTPQVLAQEIVGSTAQWRGRFPSSILDYTTPENYSTYMRNMSTILQETVGDLLFSIDLNETCSSVAVYIPPEFTGFTSGNTTNVWTSITNDYRFISLSKLAMNNSVGPGWWRVAITPKAPIPKGNYTIRIFDVKAPSVAGLYFFKIFYRKLGSLNYTSIGARKFPAVVVKADLNPAYISGQVLIGCSTYCGGYYWGKPINKSGKVVATGITPQGRTVKAQAYFNSTYNGFYILYGLAPGTYNLTAQASGFPPVTLAKPVSVAAGQSLEGVNIHVCPAPTISGTIWSKCGAGLVPWGLTYDLTGTPKNRTITIELVDSAGNVVAPEPLPLKPTGSTTPTETSYKFTLGEGVEYDGHVPQGDADYVSGIKPGDYFIKAYVNGYVQTETVTVHVDNRTSAVDVSFDLRKSSWFQVTIYFRSYARGPPAPTSRDHYLVLEAYDLVGTLKGWNITLVPAGSVSCTLELTGFLGLFFFRGIRDYGLEAGTYYLKAFMAGYIQPEPLQASIVLCGSPTFLSFELVKGGTINMTLNSVNWQDPPMLINWAHPGKNITLYITDLNGEDYGYVRVKQKDGTASVSLSCYGLDYYALTGTMLGYYMGLHDIALPTNTYFIRAYTYGYVQTQIALVSVAAGHVSNIKLDLMKGAMINVTLNFKTEGMYAPITGAEPIPVRVEVYDWRGKLAGASIDYVGPGTRQVSWATHGFATIDGTDAYFGTYTITWVNYYHTTDGVAQKDYGIPEGTYAVRAWVPGYEQCSTVTVTVKPSMPALAIIDLEKMAYIRGIVRGFNMYRELIPLSWARISSYGEQALATSSLDGYYEMRLPKGRNILAATLIGYKTGSITVQLTSGSETFINFELSYGGTSIPEFSENSFLTVLEVTILLIQLKILGRRARKGKHNTPFMFK